MNTEQKLSELVEYFQSAAFPKVPFRINKYMTIHDPQLFVAATAAKIRQSHSSDEVRESMLQPLFDLQKVCEGRRSRGVNVSG